MPQATHNVTINAAPNAAWDFLKKYENWAPLIPGYIAHEVHSDNQFTWIFLADLGFTKKTIKLGVTVADLVEPTDVKFDLKGISDNFNGDGYFKIAGDTQAEVTGSLDLAASGMMGMMINSVLENFVPKATKEFTESIQKEITALHKVK